MKILKKLFSQDPTWPEVERFDPRWRTRIERMASFINRDDNFIVDVGCGPMWLRELIPQHANYIGLDYIARGDGSLICDLNKDDLPELNADVWFLSGCLEYFDHPDAIIQNLAPMAKKCILSYCTTDNFPGKKWRRERGWRNDLSKRDIEEIIRSASMVLQHHEFLPSKDSIFVFTKHAEWRA